MTDHTALAAWTAVECQLLAAAREPRTVRQIAETAGLPEDTVKVELRALLGQDLVLTVSGPVLRYESTWKGRARLVSLTGRGDQPAA